MAYTEEERETFLALAQEVGIGRALRELGYPKSYQTALDWAKNRGITVDVDPVMSKVKAFDELYKTEHMLAVIKEGVGRIYQELTENPSLDADAQKKLSEAAQKYTNSWLLLQGKANNINETQNKDVIDAELMSLVEEHKRLASNSDKPESVEQ